MCTCLFVVLTITVTWSLGDLHSQGLTNATSPSCTAITSSCNDHSLVICCSYVVVFNFKAFSGIPYSNSNSVKCSSSSCLYNLTLCLYICEYVRTFVLVTLKIKLRPAYANWCWGWWQQQSIYPSYFAV